MSHQLKTILFSLQLDAAPVAGILLVAALLDYLIGDPWGWPHPVQVMGWAINKLTYFALKQWKSPIGQRRAGVVMAIGLIAGSGLGGWLIVRGASLLHPLLGIAVETMLLASCFAGRSLRVAAEDVLQPLATGDVATARSQLSLYVGRDTANLSDPEILRAVLETVTENATDAVMAPLFYCLVGAAILVVGRWVLPDQSWDASLPLVLVVSLAYKASSTLDSMVGYREAPYTNLGWFSARAEDVLTWLPCRLTVMTLAFLSGKPRHVWHLCCRDAIKDPSPNSGWSECAYAAIIGVQLGGTNWYRGVAKHKPLLGDPIHPLAPEQIHQALQLTRHCFLIWLVIAGVTLLLI